MRGITYISILLILILTSFVLAVNVEKDVEKELSSEGAVSVIVMLEDGSVRDSGRSGDDALSMRKEMVQEVQDKVLKKLLVVDSEDDSKISGFTVSQEKLDVNPELELSHKYSIINGFSGRVNEKGLEKLKGDPNVKQIFLNRRYSIDLADSVPQINANNVWNFSVSGFNITGNSETVCVLDTGIDSDHVAFQDKIVDQYCYCSVSDGGAGGCCPNNATEDSSAEDDNGHGTHVAGTAVGNLSSLSGVAADAKVISIKVCDAAGSCDGADILSGINWCTSNATKYNISVISISIGDGTQHNTYCNDDSLAAGVNAAVAANISVTIAAGNNHHTAGISSPACIQNATPIGAVDSSDVITYNRGNLLQLLAPGTSITAPYNNGGTNTFSGTSMSTPHVAGTIALLNQYWRLAYGLTPTPEQIKQKLAITGKVIDDTGSSGNYYYRIDVLAALQPFINFSDSSTLDASISALDNSLINITTDVVVTDAVLEWTYNNGTVMNLSMNGHNGTSFFLTVTHLLDGLDTYKIYANDSVDTLGVSSVRSITIDSTGPSVTFLNPANGTNLSYGIQAFNVSVAEANVDTIIFMFDNSTGFWFNITATNVSGNWNVNLDLTRLRAGVHQVTIFANDSAGNLNQSEWIQFNVDRTPPAVTWVSPVPGTVYSAWEGNQSFNVSITDASYPISSVLFNFDNASGVSFNITAVNQSGYWIGSYEISSLAVGSHSVTVFANNSLGNVNGTEVTTFITDSSAPSVTLNNPGSASFSKSLTQIFNCSATDDNGLANATLYGNWSGWHLNESTNFIGPSNETTFSKTLLAGTYIWNCLVYDGQGNSAWATNYTLTIDTTKPIVSAVSSGTPTASATTITWTTDESANASVNYGTGLSLGTDSSTTSFATSPSQSLSSLSASTLYYYNITSCDVAGNCQVNGTFNFTTAAAISDSAGSSGSGSSSGGGGSSVSSATTVPNVAESVESVESATDSATDSVVVSDTVQEVTAGPEQTFRFSRTVSLTADEELSITIDNPNIAVSKLKLISNVEKSILVTIDSIDKPVDLPEVEGVYDYLEINVDLSKDEIEKAVIVLMVSKDWLETMDFSKNKVTLSTYEDGGWKELKTRLVDNEGLLYEAQVEHFSYFAISGSHRVNLGALTGWATALIPTEFNSKVFVFLGLFLLIAILATIYFVVLREKDEN